MNDAINFVKWLAANYSYLDGDWLCTIDMNFSSYKLIPIPLEELYTNYKEENND